MKIVFFGTKEYDRKFFKEQHGNHTIKFLRPKLSAETAALATGFDGVCAFVNDGIGADVIEALHNAGVKYILMRCAGYNNVDLKAAEKYDIKVARVPAYSPEAVAEHAMTLAMAANRKIHKAYNKVRDNDYSLVGLSGINLYGKTAGIIGTGKIGIAMIRICKGFGMNVIASDPYPNNKAAEEIGFTYEIIEEVLKNSDLISLHCPLFDNNRNLINADTIAMMKDNVIFVNTSRGGLVNTEDLINGIKAGKFRAVGLDVYQEEGDMVFNDLSGTILEHTTTARLLSFPNVILTSHQGFLTDEALEAIAETTIQNATDLETTGTSVNIVS